MESSTIGLPPSFTRTESVVQSQSISVQAASLRVSRGSADSVSFGLNPPSRGETLNVVVDRALAQLQQVVTDAREALGIPEGAPFDTSPEATAARIADFALGAFGAFVDNHPELTEEEAKSAFVELISGAIAQGIQEAEEILQALNALTPEVQENVTTISELIQQRLDAFLNGE